MLSVSWLYIILTLFEPVHTYDHEFDKWGDAFNTLFIIEAFVISMFLLDFVMEVYHVYYEKLIKNYRYVAKKVESKKQSNE